MISKSANVWPREPVGQDRAAETWLPAIIRLQRGETSVTVWPWEESHMTLTRNGDLIQIVHHSGKVVCARVQFPFDDVVRAMLDASRPLASFVAELQSAIACYRTSPKYNEDAEAMERLEFLHEEFSPNWQKWIAKSETLLANTGNRSGV